MRRIAIEVEDEHADDLAEALMDWLHEPVYNPQWAEVYMTHMGKRAGPALTHDLVHYFTPRAHLYGDPSVSSELVDEVGQTVGAKNEITRLQAGIEELVGQLSLMPRTGICTPACRESWARGNSREPHDIDCPGATTFALVSKWAPHLIAEYNA